MDANYSSTSFLVLAVPAIVYLLYRRFLHLNYEPREPPVISPTIPLIGHMIGLLRHGTRYYDMLNAKHRLPVYTLEMFNTKTYVVNSLDMVIATQRNTKTLSFNPFLSFSSARISKFDEAGMAVVNKNIEGEQGKWGYIIEMLEQVHQVLAPGPALDKMNHTILNKLCPVVNGLQGGETFELLAWIRELFSACSLGAVYGPDWISSPELTEAFRDWERDITTMCAGIFPGILAPKGEKGRQRLFEAFEQYFRKDGQERGSDLVKVRYNAAIKNGLTKTHAAHGEAAILFGVLPNVIASTFWIIMHVFSVPALLEELRDEIANVVSTSPTLATTHEKASHRIDITQLRSQCPLLVSVYQEAMRLKSTNASVRKVLSDTIVGDKYFFAKDAVVQMPSTVIHNNTELWGTDAHDFKPRRFMKADPSVAKGPKRPPGAFRVFGGGATLCPGRHFASTEILGFVAAMIMGFDMAPAEGEWVIPKIKDYRLMTAILEPVKDVKVRVVRRKGFEDARWAYTTSIETTVIEMDTL